MSIDYLNPPEELLDRPIEPWTPRVGDRVRVVLNGECQATTVTQYPVFGPSGSRRTHEPEFDGRTGRVVPTPPWVDLTLIPPDHPYAVQFDDPYFSGGECEGSHFAACELVPLTEEP